MSDVTTIHTKATADSTPGTSASGGKRQSNMPKYGPASLPKVDAVEVLALGRHTSAAESPIFSLRPSAVFAVIVTVKADKLLTRHIAELWRELLVGRQARCHAPPFALRFFADGEMLLEASLCWQCNNIWMREGETFSVYEFDGRADASRELLAVLKAIIKGEETER